MNKTTHKQGDTWRRIGFAGIYSTAGSLIDMSGWSVSSQLRDPENYSTPVGSFTCAMTDGPTQEFSHVFVNTTAWPVKQLVMDVQFVAPSGDIVSWPTVAVIVERDLTGAS